MAVDWRFWLLLGVFLVFRVSFGGDRAPKERRTEEANRRLLLLDGLTLLVLLKLRLNGLRYRQSTKVPGRGCLSSKKVVTFVDCTGLELSFG